MKKRKNLVVFVIILIFVGLITAMAVSVKKRNEGLVIEGSGDSPTYDRNNPYAQILEYEGRRYRRNEDIETLLFMGIDDFGEIHASEVYTNDGHADFLMLAIMNRETKTYSFLHINRDIMTDVKILGLGGKAAGSAEMQIAVSHAYGSGLEDSCRNTVDAVSGLLGGVKADNYISMTMDGVAKLNDMLGGITLTVTDNFYDIPEFVKGQEVTLTGELALKYVRSRLNAADGTNLNRMERQRQYMERFLGALMINLEDEDFAVKAFDSVSEYIVTDMSVDQISDMAERISDYEYIGVHDIAGEARMGERYIEFYVDKDRLQQQIIELFYVPA